MVRRERDADADAGRSSRPHRAPARDRAVGRRFAWGEIRSIQCDASGAARRFVLRITAKRDIELMADREIDEIHRVADALNGAMPTPSSPPRRP
jgi:hypothetical protein